MEGSLHVQRPLNCKTVFGDRGSFKLKPLTGFFPGVVTNSRQSSPWRKECKAGWGFYCINADFSQRRQRKMSAAWPMVPAPKSFMPKSLIERGNLKTKKNKIGVKGDSFTPTTSELSGDSFETIDLKVDPVEGGEVGFSQGEDFEVEITNETIGEASELSLSHETLDVPGSNQGGANGNISTIDDDDILKLQKKETSYTVPAPKGFMPKSPIERGNLKTKKNKTGVKGDSFTPTTSELSGDSFETIDLKVDPVEGGEVRFSQGEDFEVEITNETIGEASELSLSHETLNVPRSNQGGANRNISTIDDDDILKLHKKETSYMSDTGHIQDSEEKPLNYAEIDETVREANIDAIAITTEEPSQLMKLEMEENLLKQEAERIEREENLHKQVEENLRKQEIERIEREAYLHRQERERIADESFLVGNKMFVCPPVAKPDQDIEVFLNRSLSTLINEPDVLIMGAFNDWRWKSFTIRLNKTHLKGDWWSCQVRIPREAYKVDFVFFNGKTTYDNNDKKDFSIPVDGGMDALAFEDFLLEEKRKELEKLAKEQAERQRRAEEQRRMEADKAAKEADSAHARVETEKRREMLQQFMKKALKCIDNVWYIEPSEFKGMELIRLYYNKISGPLANANEVWIHGGHNNWRDGLSFVHRLIKSNSEDGDWWHASVVIPDRALVLDWVFADGPPQHAIAYDNNHSEDFHAIVSKSVTDQLYWIEEEKLIYSKLQEERRLREEAICAKAEGTLPMKAEIKEKTLKRFLLSQKHVFYTEPLDVQAGSTVTVFYNPSNTNLNVKQEVWFRFSFNHWTHHNGPLPPQRMIPAENGTHVKTSVEVPLDAYMMDFIFSDREDGGVFDNKYGMDYHIPVSGSIIKEPPMHIVHIAVEMAPIAKVGGLGDVVTSLSRAVQDLSHNVDIIFPKYDCLDLSNVKDIQYHKNYFWGGTEIKVWHGKVEGLSVYFLEPLNGFFSVGCVYGRGNDAERFGFFCHAALEFLHHHGFYPDIIHCHDWSSAPVAWLFKDHYMRYGLSKARVVFTIHNLEFGGHFIGKAMTYADMATTVSPTYSREVAGNPLVAPHHHKFHGILNGIDLDIWDPYNDKFIPVSYTSENVVEGKRAAKETLQQRLNLRKADLPLVGIITRLTHQKGIHLIKHAIWRTLDCGGQVVLLGSAPDPRIQNDFMNLANELHSSHNDCARLCLTYDEPLSHLIYAAADFILVPSIFEPCGLTQLIAMRYGSIPVVRKTGGLYDTVFDVDNDKERAQAQGLDPNGFNFDGADPGGVDYALNRAISAWCDRRDWFNTLCKTVMEQDWSWNKPALDYLELYHSALMSER